MKESDARASRRSELALAELSNLVTSMQRRFQTGRRLLSFQEYLELFASDPTCHGRDAARYVRDMFDHFGTYPVKRPWGECTRYRLFDLPWEPEPIRASGVNGRRAPYHGRDAALIGHEELQGEIYRALSNFVQEGRANRLVLMHGPNGSAKSTIAGCVLRALEHYSTLDEGALYRFHWVFPSRKTTRGAIGFGGEGAAAPIGGSFAHLEDTQIDARLVSELRDHPLFLLPVPERRELLKKLYEEAGIADAPPDWLMSGKLSHKNQQIMEALLVSYEGSLADVLRHVQVERWFISRRYRTGAVTIGPELSVDAGERQITADRSLAALPTALQARTLFEAHGDLVEASGGVLEFSDLLKRPLDAFRYLQLTLETGEVSLPQQTIQTNVVMIGSANDVHLNAFREHPEFPSFRGRFELLRAPYLRSYLDEQRIYDAQIAPFVTRHVAPHATRVAAQFAVLTRMRQPEAKRYPEVLAPIVSSLTAAEKMEAYATGTPPERLDGDSQKLLRANIRALYQETDATVDFEGRSGVSPREIRSLLLDAAQSRDHGCLSPFSVLTELDELCKRTSEYDWLKERPLAGGYHDHKLFRDVVRARLLDTLEEEMRSASGLVDETRYGELFDRYVQHVGAWVKGEKIRNPHTGDFEGADERMMREIEGLLGVRGKHDDHRRGLIAMIAAWAIDHPGEKVVNAVVFPQQIRKLREAVFTERRKAVALLCRDLVAMLRDRANHAAQGVRDEPLVGSLRDEQRKHALAALDRLKAMGYCESCALDAGSALLRARFAELVT
ncbi:serine protein kinase PrkA [Polyangium sp. 15x6]|uniref:PrkA family serine protein kinase n=1 Tax=Polyangium sp. 15x6 TaxID=3042687 RepID=UPI00249C6F2C|nr:serine protein kinase PrkA [Polyangium sp. 15x6]MDI3291041.1 serine protein kinase PrkA [Polyangium sp. 15x6]